MRDADTAPGVPDRVWVVIKADYAETEIHGIFSTEALAQDMHRRLERSAIDRARIVVAASRSRGETGEVPDIEEWRDRYMIVAYEIDGEGAYIITS